MRIWVEVRDDDDYDDDKLVLQEIIMLGVLQVSALDTYKFSMQISNYNY